MSITIDATTYKDSDFNFLNGMETTDNIQYLKNNWSEIKQNEEEMLEDYVTSYQQALVIRDNRGEASVCNDKGEEIGYFYYWAELNL